MNVDYKIDNEGKNLNSYSYYQFPEVEETDQYDVTDFICYNFPYLKDIYSNKHIEIVRMIEKFTLLDSNWDGFGALPLSNNVADKAKTIVENINLNFFDNYNTEVKISPYSTLIIDWFDGDNEFSLEIGKDFLGYYCDSERLIKEVDKIEITTPEKISNAIIKIENDLSKVF